MEFKLIGWIASVLSDEVTGLKFYVLDCGCICYQRVFRDGSLDLQRGIYRNAEDGPCEICMLEGETCKERILGKTIAYNSKFGVELKP